MEIPKIHEGEYRFCLIMWEHEPVTGFELVKLCQDQLGWKKSTTYRRGRHAAELHRQSSGRPAGTRNAHRFRGCSA